MKRPSFLLLACFGWMLTPAASGQISLSVDVLPAGNPAQFGVTTGADELPPRGEGFHNEPFRQIFWMLGNGDYHWNEAEQFGRDEHHNPLFSHQYLAQPPGGTNYTLQAIITDRKTDTPPPSRLAEDADITSPIAGGGFHIPQSLPPAGHDFVRYANLMLDYVARPTERVGVLNSHFFTPPDGPGYYYLEDQAQTAFVLAFSPERTGRLIFFYQDREDAFNDEERVSIIPNYGGATLNGDITLESADNYELGEAGIYDKTLEYSILNSDMPIDRWGLGIPDPREELRLFHVLKANNIVEENEYPFMVMLGREGTTGWNDTDIGKINFTGGDNAIASNYVNSSTGLINGTNNLYFVDAALIQLKGGEPKDPNELIVRQICRCCDDPGCDEYLVSFELVFHNTGEEATGGANILIKDNSGRFDCFRLAGTEPFTVFSATGGGEVLSWGACAGNRCPATDYNIYEARYCVGDYTLNFNEFARFRFSARTNAAGLNALLDDNALEACVEFHEGPCTTVCAKSIRLRVNTSALPVNAEDVLIWNNRNTLCSPPCETCCKTILCEWGLTLGKYPLASAVAVCLVLAAVFYYFWKRRRNVRKTSGGV